MRASRVTWTAFVLLWAACWPSPARAQDAASAQAIRAEIDQLRKDFEARLTDLEGRLAAMGGQPPSAPSPAPAVQAPPAPSAAGVPSGSNVFNPDTAVIGNFLGAAGKNDVSPQRAFEMEESEVSFQAVVDPYARADFFLSFGEEGVSLEEGYATFPALPGGLQVRAGKMRAAFGKVNTLHTHVIPWADRPLVTGNLVGGEDGISDAGISVARLIPNPWFFLEGTGQVFRGDSGDLFHSSELNDVSVVGHVRGYQDISESTNVDLGVSYARGHNTATLLFNQGIGRFVTDLFGVDATVRWKPLQRSIYRSFIGRSEVIWSRRNQPAFRGGRQDASGFYVSGDYQFARRWYAGVRLDRSDRADAAASHDSGQSAILTYAPSEFSRIRGQYRRTAYDEGDRANEFLFQFQFAIGAHGAHPF
jgi:hypothetical protein